MKFLNKLFGQYEKEQKPDAAKPEQNPAPCKTEKELLERFAGIDFDKQIDLDEAIGDKDWNVDMGKGEISFGPNLDFPIQVLGTFPHSSETWLWAWANTQSGLSETVTQQARALKKYGEQNGIELLAHSEFDATTDDLQLFGLIASGMFASSGYYVADYGQGAMVVTIKSDKIDKARSENHLRVATVFPQLLSQFEMDHKNALLHYLAAKGYALSEEGPVVTGTQNGNSITAEFDERRRLTKLRG